MQLIQRTRNFCLGVKAGGIKGINLKNDELIAMNIFNPLRTDSFILISDQPGIKRLRISDIPSCNRATKGNLIFKSPKTKHIQSLYAFVLETKDQLNIETDSQKIDIFVKDYTHAQLESKPSILTAIKDNIIRYVYNPKTLSTDLFDVEKINNEINPKIFEVKKQPDLFNEVKEEIAKKRNENY